MDAKRFIGIDSRAAFAQVRKALGRDAVILSSRKVENGIEVTAGAGDPLPEEDVALLERPAKTCLLYTSPSPRDQRGSRMPSSA